MRATPKISVSFVAISVSCASLLFGLCNSVWPQETKKAATRIRELQQKRLAVLEQAHEAAKDSFSNARVSYDEVHATKFALLAARRDYAETQRDRLKACDEAV